ncbi:hypothetical protein [Cysteiniphilum marinum]|uniref:hypothetical protein n=2 Tax=Cysteiniphilum marinum TaxID=2774191 RepID=UPI00193B1835|nr:hypothetical protein [Cysteiniphilum marinum]
MAANQYVNNFEQAMQKRFGKSAEEVLNDLAAQEMTYNEAAKALDFQVGTIRKYCNRYNILLKPSSDHREEPPEEMPPIFYSKEINKHNALSRKWSLN